MVSRHLIMPPFAPCHLFRSAARRWRGVVGGFNYFVVWFWSPYRNRTPVDFKKLYPNKCRIRCYFWSPAARFFSFQAWKHLYNKNLCLGTYREEGIYNSNMIHKIAALKMLCCSAGWRVTHHTLSLGIKNGVNQGICFWLLRQSWLALFPVLLC